MSNRSSHFVRRFQTLRSALTGVSGSRRLLALAAVLALLALMLQPTAVQAQTVTTVWSATLNPVSTSVDSGLGCSNAASDSNAYCSSSSRLDDNSFDYDGTTYAFHELLLFPNGRLLLSFTTTPTEATVSDLVLNIGDSPFRLSKGNQTGGDIYWDNSGLTWTAGSDVAVTLTRVVLNPPPPVVVPPDWELIPDGLAPGSHFRLLFVTSGLYTAESTSINDYNRKVRFNAGRGHAALAAYASGFPGGGQHRDGGRSGQHGNDPHRHSPGRPHLLGQRKEGGRRLPRLLRRELGRGERGPQCERRGVEPILQARPGDQRRLDGDRPGRHGSQRQYAGHVGSGDGPAQQEPGRLRQRHRGRAAQQRLHGRRRAGLPGRGPGISRPSTAYPRSSWWAGATRTPSRRTWPATGA